MTRYQVDIPDVIIGRICGNDNDPELEIVDALAGWFSNMFGSNWVNHWKSEIHVKEIEL